MNAAHIGVTVFTTNHNDECTGVAVDVTDAGGIRCLCTRLLLPGTDAADLVASAEKVTCLLGVLQDVALRDRVAAVVARVDKRRRDADDDASAKRRRRCELNKKDVVVVTEGLHRGCIGTVLLEDDDEVVVKMRATSDIVLLPVTGCVKMEEQV